MSEFGPPWPLALLTGFLGSGKTTYVAALLARAALRDTLVIVNEFGAVGIDHHLIAAVHDDVVLLRGGCLCCQARQDLARTLRDMDLRWRRGAIPGFARVIVEASGLAEPAAIVATLLRHPLLHDVYRLCSVTTLVDAEHGDSQLTAQAVSRRQVAVADRILLTKPDRADEATLARLRTRLSGLNALAEVHLSHFGDAPADGLFAARGALPSASMFIADHDHDIRALTLTADGALAWPRVQAFIAGLLEQSGDQVLRLKAILRLAGHAEPIVVQAVHHSFYPLTTLPAWPADLAVSTLVLLHTGKLSGALGAAFEACREQV